MLRVLTVALLALLISLAPRSDARAQLGDIGIDEAMRQDPAVLIPQLEAMRRALGKNATLEQRGQVGALLLFFYGVGAQIGDAADVAEMDAKAKDISDWIRAAPGAVGKPEFATLMLEYYLNSGRPGLMLEAGEKLLTDASIGADLQAANRVYVARAYAAMGRMEEAGAALSQVVSVINRIPLQQSDISWANTLMIGFPVWADRGDVEQVRYGWLVAKQLLTMDELVDTILLQVATAGRKAALRINDEAMAREAARFVGILMARLFHEGRSEQDIACQSIMIDLPQDWAARAEFPPYFEACYRDISENNVRPVDLLMAGAAAYELREDFARAASLYAEASQLGERARASFDVASRQGFYEGSQREAYQGAVRTAARASILAYGQSGPFFEGLAAGERMRARQYADYRGDATAITPAALANFAARLPDGVLVIAITTLDKERVAYAFTNRERHTGMVMNWPHATDSNWSQTIWASVADRNVPTSVSQPYLISMPAMVLGSGRSLLAGAKRVIVLTDGGAARIPVGLWSTRDDTYSPLAASAEIVYAPALRDVMAPAPAAPRSVGFFGVGNPAYPVLPGAPGLTVAQQRSLGAQSGATRDDGGGLVLQNLTNAEFEVRDIARGFGDQATTLYDAEASEAAVKRAGLHARRFLHFATHGLLAGDFAGLLEPALVFAAGDGDDGFMTATEVQALKLDAELTVLSACNTSSGRAVAGEGVIGLSRAFLVAGSRSVLASLWPVNDLITADFMSAFYTSLRAGVPPARALKEASAVIRRDHPHPSAWAPFILISAAGATVG